MRLVPRLVPRVVPRVLALASAALVTATVTATLAASPASAVTIVQIDPPRLPRGADVAIPHLEGNDVVDGSVVVPVSGKVLRLLGKSGSAYVVGVTNEQGGHGRIYRVEVGGARTLLAKSSAYGTRLSTDGSRIVGQSVPGNGRTTVVTVWSATDGTQVARRTFRGFDQVLDASADQVLIGTPAATVLWTTATDTVSTVVDRRGYAGDLAHNLVATFTKDPFRGGCSMLSRIGNKVTLWQSCTERVEAFSTDGSRVATVALLADGVGPSVVTARTVTGKAVGRYTIGRGGWFGELTFESPTALLLEANARPRGGVVRCTGAVCERASKLQHTPTPRTAVR